MEQAVGVSETPTSSEGEAPAGLAKTVFRGAGLAGGGYIFAQALNLAVYVVLSRLILPEEFGEYAAATVLIGFGVLVTESGMQSALIQRKDRLEEAQSTAVIACVAGGLVAAAAGLAAAPLLGLIFGSSEVTALAAASSGVILVMVLGVVPNAILQRQFSFLRMVVVDPFEVIVFGVVSIVAASAGMGAWSLVIGQYAQMGAGAILAWTLVRWRPRLRLASMAMWRELVDYGRHIFFATSILRLGEQAADTLIVGKGLGTGALGQYRYAFRIASMPFYILLAGAAYVIFPALARIANDRARLQAAFLRSLRWMCALGFPAGMLLIPIGPPLAIIVFGDVWEAAGYATIGMCMYAGGSAISSAVSELLKADGSPEPLVRMHSVTTVTIALGLLALMPFGLSAAAAGLSLGALLGAAYSLRIAHKVCGVEPRAMWGEVWPPILAGAVMAFALLPLDRLVFEPATHGVLVGLGLIGAEAIIGAAVYLAALGIVSPGTPRELFSTIRQRGGGPPDLEALEQAPDNPHEVGP
jgi:PST family polysaccharide transporter